MQQAQLLDTSLELSEKTHYFAQLRGQIAGLARMRLLQGKIIDDLKQQVEQEHVNKQ